MVGSHSLEGFFRAAGGPFFHLGTIVNDLAAPTYAFVPRRGRCLIEQTNDKGCAQCARSLQELFVKQGTRSVFKRRTFSVVDSPMVELRCGGMCFATPITPQSGASAESISNAKTTRPCQCLLAGCCSSNPWSAVGAH